MTRPMPERNSSPTPPVQLAKAEDTEGERRREDWQRLVLPLMGAILVGAAVFFAVMSVVELRDFYRRVEQQPLALGQSFTDFETRAGAAATSDVSYLRFKIAALLEADALHRRYHQATATMLARVWTRQLGFLTGMLLAIVGAAFILGRLREDPIRLEGEGGGVKGAIATSSPGLVLSTLGAAIMAITLVVPFEVQTRDVATYLQPGIGATALPAPGSLDPIMRDDPGPAPRTVPRPPMDPGAAPGAPTTTGGAVEDPRQ